MTPEQRKRVAELVEEEYSWYIDPDGRVYREYMDEASGEDITVYFHPSFVGQDWQRSQALEVVEWLFANTTGIEGGIHSCGLVDRIYEAMNAKDIESILSLVLELSDDEL